MMEPDLTISSKKQERNAVITTSSIFKLVESIEKKIRLNADHTDKDLEELKLLREQCGSYNPLISVTACYGLTTLVKNSFCPLPKTVSALVASIFSVRSVTGVISALTELLILELRREFVTGNTYTCPYNTKTPQHPLVSVLKRRPEAWDDVLNQVCAVCSHQDKLVASHSFELMKPVLDYILTEANDLPKSCRQQTFKFIITYFPDKDYLIEALYCCLCWEDSRVLETVQTVTALAQVAVASKHGLLVSLSCLSLASLVPRVLLAGLNPAPCLTLLSQLAGSATNTHSTLLALLSDCVPLCPAPYLHHLLDFFVALLDRGQCSVDCLWMCVSALLPWLAANPSHLSKALHSATLIISHAKTTTGSASSTVTLMDNTSVATIVSADARLTLAIHIARLSESLRDDSSATLAWLRGLHLIEDNQMHLFVSGLLLSRPEHEVRSTSLQALASSRAPLAISHNLTVLLYQLGRERWPDNQLALLRALPSTATDKNNVLSVISTFEALRRSTHQNLALLAVDLYCQLWMCQERCYPQLLDVLGQDCLRFDQPWLAYTQRASICKAICTTKPELHGKEVVSTVSDILNKCGAVEEAPAAALALEALIPLVSHDVVDAFTIWRSLAPRFSRDKRPLVLKSLCELVSVAATQKGGSADTDNTLAQMLSWLWNLVAFNKHISVVDAALMALSKFRTDQMTLKMLPECFRRNLKLPAEMVKTPADAARKPEDVLDYIPGECWVQVLEHCKSEAVSLAVASWIKMEVASFKGSMLYQVDRPEPANYSHLPHRSIVRSVTTKLQHLCSATGRSADDTKTADRCLVALLQPTPKPLPSVSWAFLSQLSSIGDNVIRLAAKQSQISPSGRSITEICIAASEENKERIEFLYSILSDLCRGIPPVVLRPFLERTLLSAVKEKDKEHFSTLLGYIKATLKEEKIHEANRTLLHQQIKALWDVIEPHHPALSEYFLCISELPVSVVESMTSTSLMWEVTPVQLQKAFRLRAFMAQLPNAPLPLNWLNEIIDAASSNISEQTLALQLVSEVIYVLGQDSAAWPWLQELMGQTHLSTVNNKGSVEFLVSLFVLCVDIMSGYSSLTSAPETSRALRFPQAVASLIKRHGDANSMLEWLNHMRNVEAFPAQFASPFQLAARNISLTVS